MGVPELATERSAAAMAAIRSESARNSCSTSASFRLPCRHAGIVRVLCGNIDGFARDAVWVPEGRAPQLGWVYRKLPQEFGQFDYGRVSVVEPTPVVLSDEIASEHDFVSGPWWVGLGHDETQPSEECGNGGIAAGEILGGEWLAMPDLMGDPNDGSGVVEATTVIEEVAAGFAVVVLGEEFGPSEPVELLDSGEYVGGGDVWLGHERNIDRLTRGVDSLLLARPFGIPDRRLLDPQDVGVAVCAGPPPCPPCGGESRRACCSPMRRTCGPQVVRKSRRRLAWNVPDSAAGFLVAGRGPRLRRGSSSKI